MSFIYYSLLLFILFFTVTLIFKNIKVSPKKLKIYITIVLLLFTIRYSSIILMCIINNVEIVYKFKNLIYLNYLGIPLLTMAIFFIYLRFEKISFNYIYLFGGILATIYIIFIGFTDGIIKLDLNFGYIINLKYGEFISAVMVVIVGVLLIFGAMAIDKPNINRRGVFSIIIGLFFILMDNLIMLTIPNFLPYTILSEIVFLMILNSAISTFEKKVVKK